MVSVPAGRRAALDEVYFATDNETCVLCGPGPWLAEASHAAAPTDTQRAPTPLLAGAVLERPGADTLKARLTIDPDQQLLLRDHVIDDRIVVPAAMAVELMAETAALAAPAGWHVADIQSVRMLSGIVLAGAPREVETIAEPLSRTADEGTWRVRISDPTARGRLHYESKVRLTGQCPTPPNAPPLPRIEKPFPLPTVDEAYDRWLFHGPLFRGITELNGCDLGGVDCKVQPSLPTACLARTQTTGWLIDPVILDVCPQLAMLWSRAVYDTSPLPNRISHLHCYGALAGGPIELLFRVDPISDENTYKADVWLIRDGRVVGLMEGLEGAGSAALNRIAGSSSR
jgi:hypothetical protein